MTQLLRYISQCYECHEQVAEVRGLSEANDAARDAALDGIMAVEEEHRHERGHEQRTFVLTCRLDDGMSEAAGE